MKFGCLVDLKRKETSDKAVSKCGSYVPVRTAENLRPAILGFLVQIAEKICTRHDIAQK
jgi:hypothetical protein